MTLKVAIPHYQGEVAPCFEATAAITIFTIRRNKVAGRTCFTLQSQEAFDRVRLLRDQEVNTLICGGLQSSFEDLLRGGGIQVLSWVTGRVDELLELFLEGQLVAGTGRLVEQEAHRSYLDLKSRVKPNESKFRQRRGISRFS